MTLASMLTASLVTRKQLQRPLKYNANSGHDIQGQERNQRFKLTQNSK